jgi:SAM-dependent methyltransferase
MTENPAGYRMYDEFAHLWTQISAPEDYAEEAEALRGVLFDLLEDGRNGQGCYRPSILELGVGGGNNLSHLIEFVDAVAADISPSMLEISRRLNPGVEHVIGDMRRMRLGRTFDAVIIHDAISYVLTVDDLRLTFQTARAHLEPGGVFIAGPDWIKGITRIPNLSCKLGRRGDLSYAEFVHDPDPEDTEIEVIFTFYIPETNAGVSPRVRVEEDRHRHGLFPLETWLTTLRDAEFESGTRRYSTDISGGSGYYITGIAI